MENEKIIAAIKKLQFQVSILKEALDYEEHPIERLIMDEDWDENQFNTVNNIFDKWNSKLENGDAIVYREFEADFAKQLGVSYQGLKSIILSFYRDDQWTELCAAYVDSLGNSAPLEYHRIMKRKR